MELRMTVAIIYRWRLKPGKEKQFREAWRRRTVALREEAGALGSALHKTDIMRDATSENFPPIITEVIDDLLLGSNGK